MYQTLQDLLTCLLRKYPILDGRNILLYLFIERVIKLTIVNNAEYYLSALYEIVSIVFSILILYVHKMAGDCQWPFKCNRSTTDEVF